MIGMLGQNKGYCEHANHSSQQCLFAHLKLEKPLMPFRAELSKHQGNRTMRIQALLLSQHEYPLDFSHGAWRRL